MSQSQHAHGTRQLIICVDAMEWDLVRRLVAQGKLPVLRRLMEEGATAELSTPAAQLPDTVWTSLVTGLNPAKLEKYFYVQYDAATMGLRRIADNAVTAAPVWRLLSAAGRRVGIADIPDVPLARSLNGFQLSGWGTHGPGRAASYPPQLMAEVRARFGPHPVGSCDAYGDTPSQMAKLREKILAGVARHGELFRWFLEQEPYDIFFAGFSAAHCAGHHFWPSTGQANAKTLSGYIEEVYCSIDSEIGRLIAVAGNGVRCAVVSAHGMGPMCHASWNLTEILDLVGYGRKPRARCETSVKRAGSVNLWRLLKMVLPGSLQYAIRAALPAAAVDRLLFLFYAGRKDWRGRRAFAVPNNEIAGAIRISVKGRDQHGRVEPGAEYELVCREIAAALRELKDPQTGRAVARQVTIVHEEFSGPFLHLLPDLTVLWDQRFAWDSLYSPRFGTLQLRSQDARHGTHTPNGFAVFHGPGVRPGLLPAGHSIYDLAPTILAASGVPIPLGLDGRAIALDSGA